MNLSILKNKSILVTGHTGFKGAWLCHILKLVGACVTGYALEPVSGGVFEIASVEEGMRSVIGDISDIELLNSVFEKAEPEIVIHMAAQPLVLESFERPVYTYATNVMGTINLFECIRKSETVKSLVVVTTDKVYKNNEWDYGYREIDTLGGSDPYSASKACTEIVTESYRKSFLSNMPVSTTRAGNVIGGGDVAENRIIPDCVRAAKLREPIIVRNPFSVRPYQHVLEPLFAYLLIATRQLEDVGLSGSYNIGPKDIDHVTTGELTETFCRVWGEGQQWKSTYSDSNAPPRESNLLKLDCSKMQAAFNWQPVWNVREAVERTVEWEKENDCRGNVKAVMDMQIEEYLGGMR